jgi:hypothetical protein
MRLKRLAESFKVEVRLIAPALLMSASMRPNGFDRLFHDGTDSALLSRYVDSCSARARDPAGGDFFCYGSKSCQGSLSSGSLVLCSDNNLCPFARATNRDLASNASACTRDQNHAVFEWETLPAFDMNRLKAKS